MRRRRSRSCRPIPNLSAEKYRSVLRWELRQAQRPDAAAGTGTTGWTSLVRWIGELFGWLAQSGRVLMWVGAALLAALAGALCLSGCSRLRAAARSGRFRCAEPRARSRHQAGEPAARTSVPPRWQLWERGEHRAALALLYRGLLSRLVHAHQVPIRDSSTEGDCLALAARHCEPDAQGIRHAPDPRVAARRLRRAIAADGAGTRSVRGISAALIAAPRSIRRRSRHEPVPNRGKRVVIWRWLLVAASVAWIARHTYWDEVTFPMPLKGEAATQSILRRAAPSPSCSARARAASLSRQRAAADSVLVLAAWHWDLSAARRSQLERWVEAGGRLVVDRTLIGTQEKFERWSGIDARIRKTRRRGRRREEASRRHAAQTLPTRRMTLRSAPADSPRATSPGRSRAYLVCDSMGCSWLGSTRKSSLVAARRARHHRSLRVAVGRGSVTVVNAHPFLYREFLEGDHARLFVAATQLRRGDRGPFPLRRPSPRPADPAVDAMARRRSAGARAGRARTVAPQRALRPAAAPPESARRSLGEQILGTGRFVLRFGGGRRLHAATVRALDEAARRRIPGYEHSARATSASRELARLTGLDADALARRDRITRASAARPNFAAPSRCSKRRGARFSIRKQRSLACKWKQTRSRGRLSCSANCARPSVRPWWDSPPSSTRC